MAVHKITLSSRSFLTIRLAPHRSSRVRPTVQQKTIILGHHSTGLRTDQPPDRLSIGSSQLRPTMIWRKNGVRGFLYHHRIEKPSCRIEMIKTRFDPKNRRGLNGSGRPSTLHKASHTF